MLFHQPNNADSANPIESGGFEDSFPGLSKFLKKQPWSKCKVTFGPEDGEYFVACENGQAGWNVRVPDEFEKDSRTVNMAALGINGAYVILFANGEVEWACGVNYPDLNEVLEESERGDVVVCFPSSFIWSIVDRQDVNC